MVCHLQEEREQRTSVLQQQDAAYQESLSRDQAKVNTTKLLWLYFIVLVQWCLNLKITRSKLWKSMSHGSTDVCLYVCCVYVCMYVCPCVSMYVCVCIHLNYNVYKTFICGYDYVLVFYNRQNKRKKKLKKNDK